MKYAMIKFNLMTEGVPLTALDLSQAILAQEDHTHRKISVCQYVGMDLLCRKKTVMISQMMG